MNQQLTRSNVARNNVQRALQRQALAQRGQPFRPQGASQADVAGCGNQPGWNQGAFDSPDGSLAPWDSRQYFTGLPQLAPQPGPGVFASNLYRLGVIHATDAAGPTSIEIAPNNGATLWVAGLLSHNDPFTVLIHSIDQGTIPFSPLSMVDAATFATDQCYCPIELGCTNNMSPLVVTFSAIGTPSVQPFLNLIFVGTFMGGFGSCGVPGYGYGSPVPTGPGFGGPYVPVP